jgi:hypothetical protein
VAGSGPLATDFSEGTGDPLLAHLGEPAALAVGGSRLTGVDRAHGLVFEIDTVSSTLRRLAGSGVLGYSGDDGPGIAAQFGRMEAVLALAGSAGVIVADLENARARLIQPGGTVVTIAGTGGGLSGVPFTPLAEPLLPSGLAQSKSPGYYGPQGIVFVSEPLLNRLVTFEVNALSMDLSINGPPEREIVDVSFSSSVNWISVRKAGSLRDFVVLAYPGLVEEGTYEIPLTVTLTVRDLSACVSGVCPESTVTETVMLFVRVRRRD